MEEILAILIKGASRPKGAKPAPFDTGSTYRVFRKMGQGVQGGPRLVRPAASFGIFQNPL